jgi:hypothetical protein
VSSNGKRPASKRPRWHKLVSFFDGAAKSILQVNDADVVLQGWVPPDNECAVVLVPTSVTHEQGLALQKIIEAQLRRPVLVMTNNTQLVRLRPITDAEAKRVMEQEAIGGQVIQIERDSVAEGAPESSAGIGVRAEGGESDAGDLRLAVAAGGDGAGGEGEGSSGSPGASEDEPSPTE